MSIKKLKIVIEKNKIIFALVAVYLVVFFLSSPITSLLERQMIQQQLGKAFYEGWLGIVDYLSAHVLFCLIPAFFIAGAINTLLDTSAILKYMSAEANKVGAYLVASMGGFFIQVCSCTILPLFAGIWKKGAGIGVASTFLYAGPAINLLAFVLTGQRIGWGLAVIRLALSIFFAITTGIIMGLFFKEQLNTEKMVLVEENPSFESKKKSRIFWINLFSILIIGTFPFGGQIKNFLLFGLIIVQVLVSLFWVDREKLDSWWQETIKFLGEIVPILLGGVFLAGVVTNLIPQEQFQNITGKNTMASNLIAVIFGAIAYFPALVEIPIAENFLSLGMNRGPLLAYLLSDPVLSLQGLLVLNKLIGVKKTFVYTGSIVLLTTLAGYIYGIL